MKSAKVKGIDAHRTIILWKKFCIMYYFMCGEDIQKNWHISGK